MSTEFVYMVLRRVVLEKQNLLEELPSFISKLSLNWHGPIIMIIF